MKKMHKLPIIVSLIVLVLMLSSCTGIGGLYRSSRTEPARIDYHTGTEGVRLRFLTGSPPQRIYAGDALSVVIEYSNKGAFPIQGGRLYVSGYDPEYLNLGGWEGQRSIAFNAEPKGPFNPDGDITYTTEVRDEAASMPDNVDIFRQPIKVTACYEYKTEASPQVCVDPDPYNIRPEDKVCVVRDISMKSQGAPVAVTSIQQESSPKRIQFKISFANVGLGTVIAPDAQGIPQITKCPSDLTRDDIDKIHVAAFLSGKEMKCEPMISRLVNGKGFAYCYYEGELMRRKPEAYQTVLEIELSYGYMSSIATNVEILRMPGDYENTHRAGRVMVY